MLAREAAARGAWLVHYSTDYVFDGSGSAPCGEDAPTGPLNVYGRTKLDGEQRVPRERLPPPDPAHQLGLRARGGNFARTMLQLARERDAPGGVDDQIGAPTGAELLADVTAHALRAASPAPEPAARTTLAAAGETSWHGYARHVIAAAARSGQPVRVRRRASRPSRAARTRRRRGGR